MVLPEQEHRATVDPSSTLALFLGTSEYAEISTIGRLVFPMATSWVPHTACRLTLRGIHLLVLTRRAEIALAVDVTSALWSSLLSNPQSHESQQDSMTCRFRRDWTDCAVPSHLAFQEVHMSLVERGKNFPDLFGEISQ